MPEPQHHRDEVPMFDVVMGAIVPTMSVLADDAARPSLWDEHYGRATANALRESFAQLAITTDGCPECGEPLADPDEDWCDCGWTGTVPQ